MHLFTFNSPYKSVKDYMTEMLAAEELENALLWAEIEEQAKNRRK